MESYRTGSYIIEQNGKESYITVQKDKASDLCIIIQNCTRSNRIFENHTE